MGASGNVYIVVLSFCSCFVCHMSVSRKPINQSIVILIITTAKPPENHDYNSLQLNNQPQLYYSGSLISEKRL